MNTLFDAYNLGPIQTPLYVALFAMSVTAGFYLLFARHGRFRVGSIVYVLSLAMQVAVTYLELGRAGEVDPAFIASDLQRAFTLLLWFPITVVIADSSRVRRLGVPVSVGLLIAAIALAVIPVSVSTEQYATTEWVVNQINTASYVGAALILVVIYCSKYDPRPNVRTIWLISAIIGYVGCLMYLAKYLIPFYIGAGAALVDAVRAEWGRNIGRKILLGGLLVIFAISITLSYKAVLRNRMGIEARISDYLEVKVFRRYWTEDEKILGFSDGGRLSIWASYMAGLRDAPMLGCGLGYRPLASDVAEHNIVVFFLTRFGYVVGAGLLASFLWLYMYLFKTFRVTGRAQGVVRIFVVQQLISYNVGELYGNIYFNIIFPVVLGLLLNRRFMSPNSEEIDHIKVHSRPWPVGLRQ